MTLVYATFRFSLLITSHSTLGALPGTPITCVSSGPRMSPLSSLKRSRRTARSATGQRWTWERTCDRYDGLADTMTGFTMDVSWSSCRRSLGG